MLFNSLIFVLFFIVVYGLYIVLAHRFQNVLLLIASYFFYGWWDWRFLLLIALSTVVDYTCGLKIEAATESRRRKAWLIGSMLSNLGILGFFKYFNFFISNVGRVLGPLGFSGDMTIASIALPVGISFYTFQTMSYTIDIYRGELKPTRNFLNFAVFVAYFPQLVAGPIERAKRLLPQIEQPRHIRYQQIRDGFRLILLGYVLKLVIADNMAMFTKPLFQSPENHHGFNVLLGIYAAAFQIYGDFAGYSRIARGVSKLLGIELMQNFRQPYLAVSPSDFWQRWHISLSTWLRDYLYIPLGGNRSGEIRMYRNLMITMVLGGLWHGAALTFLAWGIFHGTILIAYRLLTAPVSAMIKKLHLPDRFVHLMGVVFFFHVTCFGWLLFFSKRMLHIKVLCLNLCKSVEPMNITLVVTLILFGGLVLILDYMRERNATDDEPLLATRPARLAAYCGAVAILMLFGVFRSSEFIYFQF